MYSFDLIYPLREKIAQIPISWSAEWTNVTTQWNQKISRDYLPQNTHEMSTTTTIVGCCTQYRSELKVMITLSSVKSADPKCQNLLAPIMQLRECYCYARAVCVTHGDCSRIWTSYLIKATNKMASHVLLEKKTFFVILHFPDSHCYQIYNKCLRSFLSHPVLTVDVGSSSYSCLCCPVLCQYF